MLSRLIDGGRRILDQERIIRNSGLFDEDWYSKTYPSAASSGGALAHFINAGAAEGCDPGPHFSTTSYIADYPDVGASGSNALLHYLRFGRAEGRKIRDASKSATNGPKATYRGPALARVKDAFDEEFYAATNPDLSEAIDYFQHFMDLGWKQGRDPAAWFSVDQYLRTQGDVAAAKENPFAHYLLTGCREGRAVSGSIRKRLSSDREEEKTPRIAVVAMVKNEADIIRAFSQHILALFDDIVIVDHGSEDGTAEFLGALAQTNHRVELLHLTEPSYIQSVTMTHVVRDRPQLRNADWVFLLDADEFLPFANRQSFEAALFEVSNCPVLTMQWQNLIPKTYWENEAKIADDNQFLIAPNLSPFQKIAFQPGRIPIDNIVVAQGNHSLLHTQNGLEFPSFASRFPLLHLPVRSVDQLLLKLNQGVLSYQKMGNARDQAQGTHWYQLKQATEQMALTPDHLNAVASHYSENKPALAPLTHADLKGKGFETVSYALAATSDQNLADLPQRSLGELLMRLYAQDFSNAAEEDDPCATQLKTEGSSLVRTTATAEYDTLPTVNTARDPSDVTDALSKLLRTGYKSINDLVPSDWTGHVPFMFALADLIKPRRYVELGTLHGASFFAFAQAARDGHFDNEAVAISPWAVEAERSDDLRNVFEDFSFIAQKYADFTGILRAAPEDALHRFADGSIDLLHFDGFYTYDTLNKSLHDWLPKLSNSGVILLHDIHAYEGDFGVWRVWDDLQAHYPTLTFRHAQGLGVACVGSDASPDLRGLADAASTDRSLQTLLQEHFERMGAMSAELFSRRYDMARLEFRGAAEAALIEELTSTKQELATARVAVDELRELVKGGLQRAVG